MRLWHEALIPYLPSAQLRGQHRECCALRGKGWGKKHATVDYVFEHSPMWLVEYHFRLMDEMERRGYHPDKQWRNPLYRGQYCEPYEMSSKFASELSMIASTPYALIYPEHDDEYMEECLTNLRNKGVNLVGT